MKKNEARKNAETLFIRERGRITNKELATQLGVHPATVARWKKLDDWEDKLASAPAAGPETDWDEDDSYSIDLRHIQALNERIDVYLQKKELLPSEIRELAEAKYNLMNCMEIINDQMRYAVIERAGHDVGEM